MVYKDGETVFTVPVNFECDLASIPRLPLTYLLFKGPETHAPGILHDYLCRTKEVKRKEADAVFYRALRSQGVGYLRAKMMWLAVRGYSQVVD